MESNYSCPYSRAYTVLCMAHAGRGGGGALRTTESDHRRREKECLSRATEDSNHSVSKEVGLNWRGSCPPRGHLAMSGYGHSRELLVGM